MLFIRLIATWYSATMSGSVVVWYHAAKAGVQYEWETMRVSERGQITNPKRFRDRGGDETRTSRSTISVILEFDVPSSSRSDRAAQNPVERVSGILDGVRPARIIRR